MEKRLELVQQLDNFCVKIGGKWKTVLMEKAVLGKVVIRGKVDEILTDCLVVEYSGEVYSQQEINGNLKGLPRVVKWDKDIIVIADNFRNSDIRKLFYDAELQTYSLMDENDVISASSFNRYNKRKDEVTTQATKVLSAMNVFLSRTGNNSVSRMFIQDLSNMGYVCKISFKGSIGEYLYKGNGFVEYKVDNAFKKLDRNEYGVVRRLIKEIGDNFPDLVKVLLNKETSTLYLYRECGECLICEYLESMGKVHSVKTADIRMLKDIQMG